MEIIRKWEMPNSHTFEIKCIRKEILQVIDNQLKNKNKIMVLDPFANDMNIKRDIDTNKVIYISNDLDLQYNTTFHLEADKFLHQFEDKSIDIILYDPPYSPRQVSECYKKLDKTVTMKDTQSSYFTKFKKEIARVLKPNGSCISCGWNSNGIGKTNGMEIEKILLVAHGGSHNDTIITIERRTEC